MWTLNFYFETHLSGLLVVCHMFSCFFLFCFVLFFNTDSGECYFRRADRKRTALNDLQLFLVIRGIGTIRWFSHDEC